MHMKKRIIKIGLISLVAVSTMLLSFSYKFNNNPFEINKNLELFVNILYQLNSLYVDGIDPDKLVRTGVEGMLNSLDPYTNYIAEEDMEGYKTQTTGKYGGVGALIRKSDEYVIISDPYEGFPAQEAGIFAGDKILQIDGVNMKNKSTDEVSHMLKGQPGTSVKLLLERPGENKPLTKTLTRREIKIDAVAYSGMVDSQTGYIRLGSFTENCHNELADALQTLKTKYGAKSIILDLRGNPGGLLNEAVDVANVFLPYNEKIVTTKGRNSSETKDYKTQHTPVDDQIPLAVLIDRGSASASEIVSGVFQDLDRAVVLGQRSYGKGLVQTTLGIGYSSKIKITTAKYYLPSGRCIQAIDYSGGYSESLEKIPDSLRTAFKTKNGRRVLDAGGIDPDVSMEDKEYGHITASLVGRQLLFDYATQYRIKHPNLPTPDKFELTDADWNDFKQYVATQKYEYTTDSEKLLTELAKTAEKEQYPLINDIEAIDALIKVDKQKDIEKFKQEIENLLSYEIVGRYYYQKGQIQESLEDDTSVIKAIQILKNLSEYKKMLH